jgi:hypothetical protein
MWKRLLEWFRPKPIVVYYPECDMIRRVKKSEEDEIILELIDGYEKHEVVFRAIMLYLRRKEAELCEIPALKNEADHFAWVEAQKKTAAEANVLRFLARLPLMSASMKAAKERAKNTQENTEDDI